MAPASKLPDLAGHWRIVRRISGGGRFVGSATITPTKGLLNYKESGLMLLSGARFEAYRDYLYDVRADILRVSHPDGRPFLTLRFTGGEAADTHVCGADIYRALYRFKNPDCLLIGYDVLGPRKNYRMVSCLRRQVA